MEIESELLFAFLDDLLGIPDFPDYPPAHNGLQVSGRDRITRIAVAVDAAEYSVAGAVARDAGLLLVHHGLFWAGSAPLTGRLHRRISPLIRNQVGVYAAHLPLDAHPEVGNCAELIRALDLEPGARFGTFDDRDIGFEAETDESRETLVHRAGQLLGGPVQLLPGGPDRIRRIAVLTGGGAGFVRAAAEAGIDLLLTGEAAHHSYVDAMELGINVLLGGHYRTETWGVKALGRRIEAEFGIPWEFLDYPSGL